MSSNFVWPAFFCVAAITAVYSLQELSSANREYAASLGELEECELLTNEISRLSNNPRLASLDVDSPQQVIGRVSTAMQVADIPSSSLASVAPSAPTRVGSTQYQQRLTQLSFQNVSLAKLATFVIEVTKSNDGSYVRDIVLTNASRNSTGTDDASNPTERWEARLILTQLIYSPTSQ